MFETFESLDLIFFPIYEPNTEKMVIERENEKCQKWDFEKIIKMKMKKKNEKIQFFLKRHNHKNMIS